MRLSNLPPDDTLAVVDLVVDATLSHRDSVLAREVLARLSRQRLETVVPAIVREHLENADDDAFRRLAEALVYLDLGGSVTELCEVAAASDDPHVREVARDFAE